MNERQQAAVVEIGLRLVMQELRECDAAELRERFPELRDVEIPTPDAVERLIPRRPEAPVWHLGSFERPVSLVNSREKQLIFHLFRIGEQGFQLHFADPALARRILLLLNASEPWSDEEGEETDGAIGEVV